MLRAKRMVAKEYSDHILERLELLKIREIVNKIETENNYINVMKDIETRK